MIAARLLLAALAAAFTGAAWAAPQRMTADEARFLLLRTGFAPTQAEVDAIAGRSAAAVVDELLTKAQYSRPQRPAPEFTGQAAPIPYRFLKSKEEQQAARQQQLREGLEIKTWWLGEMIATPNPLAERMTLFWHNHFATSQQKVVRSQAMWRQHQLLRQYALGDFRALLHAVAKDPAMLVYLDGANSRKEAPNENFAREVMELFTLGEASTGGGYTEQDIREAARAFTGWSIERDDFSFRFRPALHDAGTKTVFGKSGNFDGDAVLDVMLEQPAAGRFIVGKLWREFVSPEPDARELDRIARGFRYNGYQIRVPLRELLLSDAFWAPANRASLIKSPVELVVGTVRQFGFQSTDPTPFALKTAQLGQNLLVPPNVKGWPGYTAWIDSTTLLERKRFAEQLFRSVEFAPETRMAMMGEFAGGDRGRGSNRQAIALMGREGVMRVAQAVSQIQFDADRFLAQYGGHADREPDAATRERLERVVLAAPPTQPIPAGTVGVAWLRNLALDPAYQLK